VFSAFVRDVFPDAFLFLTQNGQLGVFQAYIVVAVDVVDTNYGVAFTNEAFSEMVADGAGYEDFHL